MSNSSARILKNGQDVHVDLDGRAWNLTLLDAKERALIDELKRRARGNVDWFAFDHFWMNAVHAVYDARGWSRNKIIQSPVFRIAQDLSARCAVAQGHARSGDYRDDLHILINTRFKSRRDFCRATGLSEDMLSHVLAGRKDLSMEKLAKVLAKIGYGVHIVPLKPVGRAS